jgi:hypothetical protein
MSQACDRQFGHHLDSLTWRKPNGQNPSPATVTTSNHHFSQKSAFLHCLSTSHPPSCVPPLSIFLWLKLWVL